MQLERLDIGTNFNPELGFVRRNDMRKDFALFRFSPRPRGNRTIRKYSWTGWFAYVENEAGRPETRAWTGEFGTEFQNGDQVAVAYNSLYELLPRPFIVGNGISLPAGGYDFAAWRTSYLFGQQRPLSGTVAIERGSFYSGDRTTLTVTSSRIELSPRFSLQPTLSLNWINLPQGKVDANLVGLRITHTMTPMMFVSALLQYSSSMNAVATNLRFRWEYRPGSELFVVYNEQRDTLATGFPGIRNRAVIIKVNRVVRS